MHISAKQGHKLRIQCIKQTCFVVPYNTIITVYEVDFVIVKRWYPKELLLKEAMRYHPVHHLHLHRGQSFRFVGTNSSFTLAADIRTTAVKPLMIRLFAGTKLQQVYNWHNCLTLTAACNAELPNE